MGHCGECLKDQEIKRNINSEDPVYNVLEGNKDSLGNLFRGHLCYILAKNNCILILRAQMRLN